MSHYKLTYIAMYLAVVLPLCNNVNAYHVRYMNEYSPQKELNNIVNALSYTQAKEHMH